MSGFPLFRRAAGAATRGVVSYQGLMSGYATTVGVWEASGTATIRPSRDPVGTCRVRSSECTKGVHAATSAPYTAGYTAYTPTSQRRSSSRSFKEHTGAYCDCTFDVNGTCAEWAFTDPWSKRSDCQAHCERLNCSCFDFRPGVSGDLIGGGIHGSGPVVLFGAPSWAPSAEQRHAKQPSMHAKQPSMVLSVASNFMAASQVWAEGTLSYGVMGAVTSIPEEYTVEVILAVHADGGVNSAMESWGDVLLNKYGKERYAYRRDLAMQKLGYSTDNGAYYYYNTEPGQSYETTVLNVKKYADAMHIPYRYILLDSWWYFKVSRPDEPG